MEPLNRPEPPRRVSDRLREWIDWFGPSRIITSAVGVVVVCAGAFWLVRTGPPPGEASLPAATAAAAVGPASTLPPPATAAPDSGGGQGVGMVTVHVAGAVAAPGVYVLEVGARVDAAVVAAGGVVAGGDPDALNLAAVLVDGTRIYVPTVGEVVTTSVLTDAAVAPGPVNLNQASVGELEQLPGVGPATATAIVTERDRNGPFLGVDDLERVPGIGPAKMAALRDLVTT